jgi:hypothetical protein
MTKTQRKTLVNGIAIILTFKIKFCRNDGKESYEVLSSLGYGISDRFRLVGEAIGKK